MFCEIWVSRQGRVRLLDSSCCSGRVSIYPTFVRRIENSLQKLMFVCFKGGGVHLAWWIKSIFAEFPVGPALPPHPKMYREVWVKPNPVKDFKQDCSTSLSLTPCPRGGIASWTWGLWLCFLSCMAGFPITLRVVKNSYWASDFFWPHCLLLWLPM